MNAWIIYRDQEYLIDTAITLGQALQDIDLSPEMVMALRDGRLMMEDEIIKEGDRIKLISVISGGSH
jgi:sulfur carrier protein ThiS